MHPTVPPRTCAPWSSSIGIDGRHASEPVVFFVGMPTLKQNWTQYSATDKSQCVGMATTGGPASYVELVSCLEVMRDARTIRNTDPLEGDLSPAPVGTRRGKRK